MKILRAIIFCTIAISPLFGHAQTTDYTSFSPGLCPWSADDETQVGARKHINAHGGGILIYDNKYYWFGEDKSGTDNKAHVGVRCYSSTDLYNWKSEGVALAVDSIGSGSEIEDGCIIERPKVIYNEITQKFVMYFHHELKVADGQDKYQFAHVGIASADHPTGPYTFHQSMRPDAGILPMSLEGDATKIPTLFFYNYIRTQYQDGHMSRDMTLFVDPDTKKAYHISASEGNYTLHISELSDDYLSFTGKFERVAPGGNNEAPAIFKRDGRYYMITSGCTGWSPNPARLLTATNIMGPWTEFANPCVGNNANTTFRSQGTYILPVPGKKNAYIYMGDRWKPNAPWTGSYVWLPIQFDNGLPKLEWLDNWDLSYFDEMNSYEQLQKDIASAENLVQSATFGDEVYQWNVADAEMLNQAIAEARKVGSSALSDDVTDAIIKLSNAAATFQCARNPRQVNEIEPGIYYIKVGDLYMTNLPTIAEDASLTFTTERMEGDEQKFRVEKDEATGRYRFFSLLDGRSVSEKGHVRKSWGSNDHLWRYANIRYNGEKYMIQFDGQGWGTWAYNSANKVVEKKDYRLLVDESQFIFTLEKTDVSGVETIEKSGVDVLGLNEEIVVKSQQPVMVEIFSVNGIMVYNTMVNGTHSFPVSKGVHIVKVTTDEYTSVNKISS